MRNDDYLLQFNAVQKESNNFPEIVVQPVKLEQLLTGFHPKEQEIISGVVSPFNKCQCDFLNFYI